MFETKFDEMNADIWFDERDRIYASEEGIGDFNAGFNTFNSIYALVVIKKYDYALHRNHYAGKYKRLRAQRNSIVTAFGPEMAHQVGYA